MGVWESCKPFVTGSLSGSIAGTIVQPIDIVKVRIQLAAAEGGNTSVVHVAQTLLRQDGPAGFFQGITAMYARQVLYTGSRLGLYDQFTAMASSPGEATLPFWKTSLCALSAGGIAAVIGNPADLSLVRMQADNLLPEAQRRNYKHVLDAFTTIVKQEGAQGLLQGAPATACRAMALNFGMLAFNSKAKDQLAAMGFEKGGNVQVFGAALAGGFFGSVFSLPFDFVKTQLQKMKPDPATGEMPFKGPADCAWKTLRASPLRFYSGFPVYFARTGPVSTITLIAQDRIKKLWAALDL
ncbi:DTC [Symbiodinium natans]|uniref:DTC protein n=1 Tax=Symbiodinium natans TaxID=878477 RepID=A0A812MDR6_9DINO|nr:DTC [Symbiodinium natans]